MQPARHASAAIDDAAHSDEGTTKMMLSTLVLALALPLARAGKFDKYTSCEMCIEAGWGWNEAKGKCGAFPNKVCGGFGPQEVKF